MSMIFEIKKGDTLTVHGQDDELLVIAHNGWPSHRVVLATDQATALHKALGEWLESEKS